MSSPATTTLSGHKRRNIDAGIPSGHKPQRLSNDDNTASDSRDRISHLHDSILSHILSFLPTKDAVATSLLSRRWKFIWTNIHTLYFSERADLFRWGSTKYGKERFAEFVNKVLASLNQTVIIDKFHLEIFEYFPRYDIASWINTALALKVKMLEFCLTKLYCSDKSSYRLSHCGLFTCETLEVLVLHGKFWLDLPSVVCLPNVKTLHLLGVIYGSDECVRKLISGCSSLETLYVEREGDDSVATFSISSPTLRNLTFKFYDTIMCKELEYKLEINAPALKYLDLLDNVSEDFVVENLCSLDEAIVMTKRIEEIADTYHYNTGELLWALNDNDSDDEPLQIDNGNDNDNDGELLQIYNENDNDDELLQIDNDNNNDDELLQIDNDNDNDNELPRIDNDNDRCSKAAVELLQRLHNVKHLSLRANTFKALSHAGVFPSFSRLTQLTVEAQYCGWNLLLELIKGLDKLECLTFSQTGGHNGKHKTCWRTPEELPTCFLASLRKVSIARSKGSEDELAMIAYILKNARILETMTIEACYTLLHESILQLFQRVSEFSRRSEECKIKFYQIVQTNSFTSILISEMGNEIGGPIN